LFRSRQIPRLSIADFPGILLADVREMIGTTKQRELPGITPFRVHEHYINIFVEKWERLCLNVFKTVESILKDNVSYLCEKVFGRFSSSGLLYDVKYNFKFPTMTN
jgi:hypothetical protein